MGVKPSGRTPYRFYLTPGCDPPLEKHAGGGGEEGEGWWAGTVKGNSVASSLLQNQKRSESYRKNTLLQFEIHHTYFNRS